MSRRGRADSNQAIRIGIGWDALPLTTVIGPGETKIFHVSPRYVSSRLERITLAGNYLELRMRSLQVGRRELVKHEGAAWVLNHQEIGLQVNAREPVSLELHNPTRYPRQLTAAFHFEDCKR